MNILAVYPTAKLQQLVDILRELYPEANIATDYDGMGGVQYAFNNPVDMIYTGLCVPPLHGFDVIRLVRKVQPQVQAFAIAGTTEYLDEARARNLNGYFLEPVSLDNLLHGNLINDDRLPPGHPEKTG